MGQGKVGSCVGTSGGEDWGWQENNREASDTTASHRALSVLESGPYHYSQRYRSFWCIVPARPPSPYSTLQYTSRSFNTLATMYCIMAAFTPGVQIAFGHPCIPPHQARLSRYAACIQRILRERRDDMQHASASRLQHDSGRAADKCRLGQSARFSDQRSCSRNATLDQRIGSATHSTVTTVPNYTVARRCSTVREMAPTKRLALSLLRETMCRVALARTPCSI
jgi:hypothetical protein